MKLAGLLLLGVYAAALGHQILPHDPGHGNGKFCSLCLLLSGVVLLALGVALVLQDVLKPFLPPSRGPVFSRCVRQPFSLRGPPTFSF